MSDTITRELRTYTEDADFFPADLEASCLADYSAYCRANPSEEWPPFDEWRWEWLQEVCRDQADAAYLDALDEAAEFRAGEEVLARMPMPVYGDDDCPF